MGWGLELAWGVSGGAAIQEGRCSRSHWNLASEEDCGQPSPASSWLGQPNPLGQWLRWSLGRRRGRIEEAAAGMAQGNAGGPLPGTEQRQTCKYTILWESVLAFSSRPASTAEAQVTEGRAGSGGDRG